MLNKEEISEKFFNNVNVKYLKEIEFITPGGNKVKALICRLSNKFLGSLYIYNVNGEDVEQFVPSMPKIHYIDKNLQLENNQMFYCFEKMDGTCIIMYPLLNKFGKVIEVVAKSRNTGCLDKDFQKLYDQVDTLKYEHFLELYPDTVFLFELYGKGNPHEIQYTDKYLDLAYIGAYEGNRLLPKNEDEALDYKRPEALFVIYYDEPQYILQPYNYYNSYQHYYPIKNCTFKSLEELINHIQEILQTLNEEFYKVNKRLATEGVVVNCVNEDGKQCFIKVKPYDIELLHKSQNGIPRKYIMKEIMKFMDEYHSQAKVLYEENPSFVMDYINRHLGESFEWDYISNSQSKIRRLFEKQLYPKPNS